MGTWGKNVDLIHHLSPKVPKFSQLFQHYKYNKFIECNYGKGIVASVEIILTLP